MTLTDLGPNEHLIGKPGSRAELGTPALVLDLDLLDANISNLAAHAVRHGYEVRPPAKIHKSVNIARRQVSAGALGPCCSTLYEAEVMVRAGVPGVMLFTTVVTIPKLDRLAALCALTEELSVVTDHSANVRQLEGVARKAGRSLTVLIDFEIGGGRTGVVGEGAAVRLAQEIADSPVLEFGGVQGYVGLHQVIPDYYERTEASRAYVEPLRRLTQRLDAEGLAPRIVTGGGTGTHDIDPHFGVFTELQPGTYIFGDVNYREAVLRRDCTRPFSESLHVLATVISAPQDGYAITDSGTKELNGYTGPIKPIITQGAFPDAEYSLVGDDMGRIDFAKVGERLSVGDRVELLPALGFQTIIHHRAYHCVSGDELVDIWPIDALPNW